MANGEIHTWNVMALFIAHVHNITMYAGYIIAAYFGHRNVLLRVNFWL